MIDERDPSEPKQENEPAKREPLPNAKRISEQEHDAIYAAWSGGLTSSVSLGLKFGYSDETIRVLIKHGNKRRGWQPFAARKAVEGTAIYEATKAAQAKITDRVMDAWERAKDNDLALINNNKILIAGLIAEFRKGLASVDFSKMSSGTACNNARSLAAAVDTLIRAESLLLGKPTERKEINPGDGWSKLTEAQLEFIAANGKLPPDVSEDVLFGAN